jgi:hypothetical protein
MLHTVQQVMQLKEDKMGKRIAYSGETCNCLKCFNQKSNGMGAKSWPPPSPKQCNKQKIWIWTICLLLTKITSCQWEKVLLEFILWRGGGDIFYFWDLPMKQISKIKTATAACTSPYWKFGFLFSTIMSGCMDNIKAVTITNGPLQITKVC